MPKSCEPCFHCQHIYDDSDYSVGYQGYGCTYYEGPVEDDGYDHICGLTKGLSSDWIKWIRVDFDYKTDTEYLLRPVPIPDDMIKAVRK